MAWGTASGEHFLASNPPLQQVIFASSFGVKSSNSDNATQLQTLFDAAYANGLGEAIYLDVVDVVKTSAQIKYSPSTYIYGPGAGLLTIQGQNLTVPIFAPKTPSVRSYNLFARDFGIDNISRATVGGVGFDLTNQTDARLMNIQATNVETGFKLATTGVGGGCLYNVLWACKAGTVATGFLLTSDGAVVATNANSFFGCRTTSTTANGWNFDVGNNNSAHACGVETFGAGNGVRVNDAGIRFYDHRFENSNGAQGIGLLITALGTRVVLYGPYWGSMLTTISDLSTTKDTIVIGDIATPGTVLYSQKVRLGLGAASDAQFYMENPNVVALRNQVDSAYSGLDLGALTVRSTLSATSTITASKDIQHSRQVATPTGAAVTYTPDATAGEVQEITQGTTAQTLTIAAPANRFIGQFHHFKFIHFADASAWALSWNAVFKRAAGAFANTNTSGAIDTISFYDNGTTLNEVGRAINQS